MSSLTTALRVVRNPFVLKKLSVALFKPSYLASILLVCMVFSGAIYALSKPLVEDTRRISQTLARVGHSVSRSLFLSNQIIYPYVSNAQNDSELTSGQRDLLAKNLESLRNIHQITFAWILQFADKPSRKDTQSGSISTSDQTNKGSTFIVSGKERISSEKTPTLYPSSRFSWELVKDSISIPIQQQVLNALSLSAPTIKDRGHGLKVIGTIAISDTNKHLLVAAPVTCISNPTTNSDDRLPCQEILAATIDPQAILQNAIDSRLIEGSLIIRLYKGDVPTIVGLLAEVSSPPNLAFPSNAVIQKKTVPFAIDNFNYLLEISMAAEGMTASKLASISRKLIVGNSIIFFIWLLLCLTSAIIDVLQQDLDLTRTRLSTKEEQLQALSDESPIGIIVLNKKNECIYVNKSGEELLCRTAFEIVGHPFQKILASSEANQSLIDTAAINSFTELPEMQFKIALPGGTTLNCIIKSIPIMQDGSNLGHSILFYPAKTLTNTRQDVRVDLDDEKAFTEV